MPGLNTVDEFLQFIQRSGLLDKPRLDSHLQKLTAASPLPDQPNQLAALLVRDGLLTSFQARQLLAGKFQGFTILGKYKILEMVGVGGMGKVFLCEHMLLRRLVAVKVLPRAKTENPLAVERFYREARAVAALDHPNIVRCFDVDRDGMVHFMVMEYVDGSSLDKLVAKQGPMDILRAAHYIAQSARGLQSAHEAGWVHRDVKPANILLDRTGVVKLLDLGLARLFADQEDNLTGQHSERTVLGTADYIAPEQAVASHDVDIRADIYSLGCTFYFVLTGRPPFAEGSMTQKLIWHQMRQPTPVTDLRPEVTPEMAAIVDKMLAKDATLRYQLPSEVVEALKPWTETPIPPPPESEMPRVEATPVNLGLTDPRNLPPTDLWNPLALDSNSSLDRIKEELSGPHAPTFNARKNSTPPPRSSGGSLLRSRSGDERPNQLRSAADLRSRSGEIKRPPLPGRPSGSAPRPTDPNDPKGRNPTVANSRAEPPSIDPNATIRKLPRPGDDPQATARKITLPPGSGVPSTIRKMKAPPQPPPTTMPAVQLPAETTTRRSSHWPLILAGLVAIVSIGGAAYWFGLRQPPAVVQTGPQATNQGTNPAPGGRQPLVVTRTRTHPSYKKANWSESVRDAIHRAQPGDRILLLDTSHEEPLELDGNAKSIARNITVESGHPSGKATTWRVKEGAATILSFAGVAGVTFKNIEFDGEGQVDNLVTINGRCPGLTLEDVQLRGFRRAAVVLTNGSGTGQEPIGLRRLRTTTTKAADAALAFAAPRGDNQDILVSDCRFEGPYKSAVRIDGTLLGAEFRRNRFFRCGTAFDYQGTNAQRLQLTVVSNTFFDVQRLIHLERLPSLGADNRDSRLTLRANLLARTATLLQLGKGLTAERVKPLFSNCEYNVVDKESDQNKTDFLPTRLESFELSTDTASDGHFLRYPPNSPLAEAGPDGTAVGVPPMK